MAAELSTGALAMAQVYHRKPVLSLLVVKIEATFVKKATGRIYFTCNDGKSISEAADKALASGEAAVVQCRSAGRDKDGELIAECIITWSFKKKQRS
jgi:hypothetical protein